MKVMNHASDESVTSVAIPGKGEKRFMCGRGITFIPVWDENSGNVLAYRATTANYTALKQPNRRIVLLVFYSRVFNSGRWFS